MKTRKAVTGSQSSDKQGKEGEGGDLKSNEKKSKQLLAGKKVKAVNSGEREGKSQAGSGVGSRKRPEKQPQVVKALKSSEKVSKH